MKTIQIKNIINTIGKFKDLKRSGWLMHNVSLPESDADHSFGVALLAMILAPEELDKSKCIELALVHDLAEIYAGDFTPYDDISKENKAKLEREGALRLSKELICPKIVDLFDEYNAGRTAESKFVNLLDKLETVMTAKYYDDNQRSPKILMVEFSEYAKNYVKQFDACEVRDIIEGF